MKTSLKVFIKTFFLILVVSAYSMPSNAQIDRLIFCSTDEDCPDGQYCFNESICLAEPPPPPPPFPITEKLNGQVSTATNYEVNACVEDVQGAYDNIRDYGDIMGFNVANSNVAPFVPKLTVSAHLQGMQRLSNGNENYIILTRDRDDGDPGGILVVHMGSRDTDGRRYRSNRIKIDEKMIEVRPPDPDVVISYTDTISPTGVSWEHPGGIQLIGNMLAVGVEVPGQSGSEVWFYDVTDPTNLVQQNYTIVNTNDQAAATAITRLEDGRYLVGVLGRQSEKITFYITENTNIFSPSTSFQHVDVWHEGELLPDGDDFPRYQAINFVTQCDGQIFMIGIEHEKPSQGGDNIIGLYEVDVDLLSEDIVITHIGDGEKEMFVDFMGMEQANLTAAAGIYIDPQQRMILYATEKESGGPSEGSMKSVRMMEFAEYHQCDHIGNAWAHVFRDGNYRDDPLFIDYVDRDLRDYADYPDVVENMNDKMSSARWCLPVGYQYGLYKDPDFMDDVLPLDGNGSMLGIAKFWLLPGNLGFNDEISSSQFIEKDGWTEWFDRDDSSGTGDWEVKSLQSGVCNVPQAIEGRIVGTETMVQETGEIVTFSPSYGLACKNSDQDDGFCEDYEVRYFCP